MDPVRQTQKKYCSRAMTLAILISLGFILAGYKPIGKGLVLGTFFSIINFILMGETLSAKLGETAKKTFVIALGSIFFRYLLLAAPLIIGLKIDQINFFSVIAGIFSVQMVIVVDHLAVLIFSNRKKKFRNTV
ncbi:MAG: ATP synthase subunit I [Deltaproteobacteria bacterium]|nr:ATP synthase subunit I [Deltaproteobacteria bacterium]